MTKAANDDREDPAKQRYEHCERERELGRQACMRGDELTDDASLEYVLGYGEKLMEKRRNEQ